MTGIASGRGFLLRHRNGVAAFTLRRFVLAQKRIFGVLVVVERRGLPVLFAMTGSALGAKHAFVIVDFFVTGQAIGLEVVLVQMACMAALAFDRFVFV